MSEPIRDDDDPLAVDLFLGLLRQHGRKVLQVTLIVTGTVMLAGAVYLYWGQPVRRVSTLGFRPTFRGAAAGTYPNGLPFAPTDVAAGPIVDVVYETNKINEFCPREIFRSGFFVEQHSVQSTFLEAEYQARLAEPQLNPVDRQRLGEEYVDKHASMPLQYRLVFILPRECRGIPEVLLGKSMNDVLSTWALESEAKRGVLNHQTQVLTPAMLDIGLGREGSRLLRADLIRTALDRIIANTAVVQSIPGADLVRFGPERLTFMEVRNKLVDLVRSSLEPLVVSAGQSMIGQSLEWVSATLASAEREQRAAEGRKAAHLEALAVYSGQAQRPTASRGPAPSTASSSDVQTLTPQIDSTFIDRIVEMSESNTRFRRDLTQAMVAASVAAVEAADRASYYRNLVASLRRSGGLRLSPAEVDSRLNEIVDRGKALTKQFNDLYDEFSRVGLRAAAVMYQIEQPVRTDVSRQFTTRNYQVLVASTFLAMLLLAFGFVVIRDRMRTGRR